MLSNAVGDGDLDIKKVHLRCKYAQHMEIIMTSSANNCVYNYGGMTSIHSLNRSTVVWAIIGKSASIL